MDGEIKKLEEMCTKFGGKLLKVTKRQFEERAKAEGFTRGYREAITLALTLIDRAVVTPLSPLGKR